jgi:hypothetical protein
MQLPARSDVIACTLTPAELAETQQAWQKLFRLSLLARTEIPGGLRLEFHPGSAEALAGLVAIEHECCRWIAFRLEGGTVEMTAAGAGEASIRAMWTPAP